MARPRKNQVQTEAPKPAEVNASPASPETCRVIGLFKEEGSAYGLVEFEVNKADLMKVAKVISKSEPDIFAIFIHNLTKKAREIFNI